VIIDSHAHYTHPRFDQSFNCLVLSDGEFSIVQSTRERLLESLKKSGVEAIIEPAIGMDSNEKIRLLAGEYPGFIFPAYGCHPTRTYGARLRDRKVIADCAAGGCVAIGETGLDYHYRRRDQHRMKQKRWFRYQIKLAYRLQKPLVLHIRDAEDDALKILRRMRKYLTGGVVHCFRGDLASASKYVELGFYIGIGASLLTEEDGERLTGAVAGIPLERIVAETDAPFVMPDTDIFESKKQKYKVRNTSATVYAVVERIAQIRNMSAAEIEKTLYENTVRLFSLGHSLHRGEAL